MQVIESDGNDRGGELVRCRGVLNDGAECRSVLYRAWPDRLLLEWRDRSGERSEAMAAGTSLLQFTRRCARCGTRWLAANPLNPTRVQGVGGVLQPVA